MYFPWVSPNNPNNPNRHHDLAVLEKNFHQRISEFRIEERSAKASKVRLNSLHQFSLLFLEKDWEQSLVPCYDVRFLVGPTGKIPRNSKGLRECPAKLRCAKEKNRNKIGTNTHWKLNSSPLNMDGWKDGSLPFLEGHSSGAFFKLRGVYRDGRVTSRVKKIDFFLTWKDDMMW